MRQGRIEIRGTTLFDRKSTLLVDKGTKPDTFTKASFNRNLYRFAATTGSLKKKRVYYSFAYIMIIMLSVNLIYYT